MKQRAKDLMLSTYEIKLEEYQQQIGKKAQELQDASLFVENKQREAQSIDRLIGERRSDLLGYDTRIAEKESIVRSLNDEIIRNSENERKKIEEYEYNNVVRNKNLKDLQDKYDFLLEKYDILKSDNVSLEKSYKKNTTLHNELLVKLSEIKENIKKEDRSLKQLIDSQEAEKENLIKQKKDIENAYTTLKKEEKQLYDLRGDLGIIRDRYIRFAQDNNLPFTA